MKRAMLVVNPCAGRKIPSLDVAYIVLTLQKHGYVIKVYYTQRQGDATALVKNYGSNFDTIICCGGDGTFHEVVNGVLTLDVNTPIGYIPTGTTNDFARSIGISHEIREAVKTIIKNKSESYDIGCFNSEYFTYVASFGAFSDISYMTSQKSKNLLGHFAYILEALKNLKKITPVRVKFRIGDKTIEDEIIFGAIVNSLSIGGILKFKKDEVKLDDGKFEVILIRRPKDALSICDIIKCLRKGNYNNENIIFGTAKNIQAEFEGDTNWNLDGEYVEAGKTVAIESLQKRVKIIK